MNNKHERSYRANPRKEQQRTQLPTGQPPSHRRQPHNSTPRSQGRSPRRRRRQAQMPPWGYKEPRLANLKPHEPPDARQDLTIERPSAAATRANHSGTHARRAQRTKHGTRDEEEDQPKLSRGTPTCNSKGDPPTAPLDQPAPSKTKLPAYLEITGENSIQAGTGRGEQKSHAATPPPPQRRRKEESSCTKIQREDPSHKAPNSQIHHRHRERPPCRGRIWRIIRRRHLHPRSRRAGRPKP